MESRPGGREEVVAMTTTVQQHATTSILVSYELWATLIVSYELWATLIVSYELWATLMVSYEFWATLICSNHKLTFSNSSLIG